MHRIDSLVTKLILLRHWLSKLVSVGANLYKCLPVLLARLGCGARLLVLKLVLGRLGKLEFVLDRLSRLKLVLERLGKL